MKILHTSDWHIGKKLMGRERYGEYVSVLSEISDICEREKVDMVLVAGDVYDTYTPSAEAEEIFYNGVKEIAKHSAVLIISGNHDDYVRLTAAAKIAEELNIYIIGNNLNKISCAERGRTYPVEADCGYVIFQNDRGEQVYINTLPYPNEARFKEGKSDECFADKMTRWISYGQRGNIRNLPSVFLAHIFAAGGMVSDSEREIDLGGARIVGLDLFPDCSYAALGHLHKKQQIGGKNYYYSGAPMQFSFDESNTVKSVNIFEISAEGVQNFCQIPLKNIKNLVRLQAADAEAGVGLLMQNKDFYVELTLNLTAPLTPTESLALRRCENLISLKTNVDSGLIEGAAVSNKNKSSSELFTDYYKSKFGSEPTDDLKALFLSLTEEE